jgi:copper chaperone CopZ
MNSIKILMAIILLLSFSACQAQIKSATTENVKIYGNCEICEKTIEKAGNLKKVAQVDWNKDTKMAILTYDSKKTNQSEILKRIALAGYDSDEFLAPDDVYAKLASCCKYERVNKSPILETEIVKTETVQTETVQTEIVETETVKTDSIQNQDSTPQIVEEVNQLKAIFDTYFLLKNALVKSNQKSVSSIAKNLLSTINEVKMEKLSTEEHMVLMKVMSSLKSNTNKIATATSIEKQRTIFMGLSANMYSLIKVSKQETPIYYQYCPMYNGGKGSNWLSKEKAVKNPYYGSQMLNCGSTVETIK